MKKTIRVLLSVAILATSLSFFCSCEDVAESIGADGGDSPSQVAAPTLVYCYGGFKGGNAVEDPDVQISNLKINGRSGLSYSWSKNDITKWGLAYSDAGAVACAFYLGSDGKWYGGKFDWISASRRTRDFANINSGYNGWNPDAFYGATKRGFTIVSEDGKKRTNFIIDERY